MGLIKTAQPALHADQHLPDGSDPIPNLLISGSVGTWTDAVRVADLTCWWRLGDTFTPASSVSGAAADSAVFDSHSPRDLDYTEASVPGRVTLGQPNPNLGTDDDGAVTFTNQTLGSGFVAPASSSVWDVTKFGTTGDQARSFICWIKTRTPLPTIAGFNTPIVGRWGVNVGVTQVGWVVEIDRTTNTLQWRLKTISAEVILTSTVVAANTWYFVVGTYDGTTYKLYLNGLLADSETSALIPDTPLSVFGISYGIYETGITTANRYFDGTIDEVALYKRALTADEIGELAAGGSTTTNGFLTVWVDGA